MIDNSSSAEEVVIYLSGQLHDQRIFGWTLTAVRDGGSATQSDEDGLEPTWGDNSHPLDQPVFQAESRG